MRFLVPFCAICLGGLAAADPAENVLNSLGILDIEVSDAERATITTQFSDAPKRDEYPEWFDRSGAMLVDMALLSQRAERPAARGRLIDMHFQLLDLMVPEANTARDLVNETNPVVLPLETGIGLAEDDIGWAMMLEAMHRDLPDDPRDVQIADGEGLMTYVTDMFQSDTESARHFLVRVDAWGMGTIGAWNEMTTEERAVAVAVVTESAVPSEAILQKVIGTDNVLFWLAGMDIGLTEEEREDFPELSTYLAEGYMAGGMDGILAQWVTMSSGAAAAELGTTMMMMELNYDLLFGNNLTAGGLMGLE